jgi:hypothetical protein
MDELKIFLHFSFGLFWKLSVLSFHCFLLFKPFSYGWIENFSSFFVWPFLKILSSQFLLVGWGGGGETLAGRRAVLYTFTHHIFRHLVLNTPSFICLVSFLIVIMLKLMFFSSLFLLLVTQKTHYLLLNISFQNSKMDGTMLSCKFGSGFFLVTRSGSLWLS